MKLMRCAAVVLATVLSAIDLANHQPMFAIFFGIVATFELYRLATPPTQ